MRILYSFSPKALIMDAAMAMASASVSGLAPFLYSGFALPMISAPNWKNSLYLPLCGLSYLKHWPK